MTFLSGHPLLLLVLKNMARSLGERPAGGDYIFCGSRLTLKELDDVVTGEIKTSSCDEPLGKRLCRSAVQEEIRAGCRRQSVG